MPSPSSETLIIVSLSEVSQDSLISDFAYLIPFERRLDISLSMSLTSADTIDAVLVSQMIFTFFSLAISLKLSATSAIIADISTSSNSGSQASILERKRISLIRSAIFALSFRMTSVASSLGMTWYLIPSA